MALNPKWTDGMQVKINAREKIDVTDAYIPAVQFLVSRLASAGIPYKIFQLGAGVKRITTETDTCPCCKRKL